MQTVEYVLRGSIPYKKKVHLYLELHISFLNLKGKHLKILHENQKLIHPNLDNMKLGEGRERERRQEFNIRNSLQQKSTNTEVLS